MSISNKIISGLSGIALAVSVGINQAKAAEYNPNGWPISNLSNLNYWNTIQVRNDGKSKKIPDDTIITLIWYKSVDGSVKVSKIGINGNFYAWNKKETNNTPYTIVDENCDGLFDMKYSGNEFFDVPDCIADKL